MKPLQFHNLIAACLANLIVPLAVFFVASSTTIVAPVVSPRFEQILFSKGVDSNRTLVSPVQAQAPEPELPETSNQNAVELAGRLTPGHLTASAANQLADIHNFVTQISNGRKDMLRGVYVPGIMALPIIQQPENNPIFVSNKHDLVTQFQSAARNGVTGLLAHNHLAGRLFYKLAPGQEVLIIHGDGSVQPYRVVSIHRFQKLRPSSLHSNLVDLSTGQELPGAQVFRRFYRGEHRVTFQTCLARNGRLDWGFLFVVATPVVETISGE